MAVLCLAVYWPATGYDFVNFDDPLYVTQNEVVRKGLTLEGARWAFNVGYTGNWHPLTWLAHMTDVELFGLRPSSHHLTNVLLHSASAALLVVLLAGLLRRARPGIGAVELSVCALAAAAWAVHPLRVESVAWISERKDVLAGLLWFLALLAYLRYTERRSAGRYALVALATALGLMAKPMVISLPLVLLILDVWPLQRVRLARWREADARSELVRLVGEKLPLLLLAAASGWVTLVAQRVGGSVSDLPIGLRLSSAAVSYTAYLGQLFWPARLAVFYPFPTGGWPVSEIAVSAAVLLAISLVVWAQARRWPWLAVGWSWYLITLLPVSGIVQIGRQFMADRYTYLPHVGLYAAAAWGLATVVGRSRWRRGLLVAAGAVVLAASVMATRWQLTAWRDSITLFNRAVEATRDNYLAHHSLALELARLGQPEKAIPHDREAVRIDPAYYRAHEHLGFCLAQIGRVEEGIRHIEQAIRLRPDYALAHRSLGQVLLQASRPHEAVRALRQSVALEPTAETHQDLGAAYEALGREASALEAYRRAVSLDPELHAAWAGLGRLHARRGEWAAAVEHLEVAARLRPGDPEVPWMLALVELSRGDRRAAERHYETLRSLDPARAEQLRRRIAREPTP